MVGTAVLGGLVTVIGLQFGQIIRGRNPVLFLRTGFWHDQLGYLAIVADARNGHVVQTEPVTMTGVNHYPRFYYSAVGTIARVLGLESIQAWNLTSLVLQLLAATAMGVALASLSRRWWAGLLAPLPFFTGVFAYAVTSGSWYTVLQAHAVLWGPAGVLFSNNAETAGLCVGMIAISAVVVAWAAPRPRGVRGAVTIVAAAAVGGLSSFQTYSFLTVVYLMTYAAAIAGVLAVRRRTTLLVVSGVMLALVFVFGPVLAEHVGQLPTLLWGLLPTLPGLAVAVVRTRGIVALAGAAAVAAAIPQVLYTALGILGGDPFLSYRVASNHQLGIVSWEALVGAIPVAIPLVGSLVIAAVRRDRVAVVLAGSGAVALPLLALNDVWGANAEPYRFWIEGILLGGMLSMLALARLLRSTFPVTSHARTRAVEVETTAGTRRALGVVIIASGLVWAASLPDWAIATLDGTFQAAWNPDTPRERAITALARDASLGPDEGLVTTELCIDNRTTKATSGAPIANYHLGMAWPADRVAIDAITVARDAGELDFGAMADSDTRWVLTDSNCDTHWDETYRDRLTLVDREAYAISPQETIARGGHADGVISLWKVSGQR